MKKSIVVTVCILIFLIVVSLVGIDAICHLVHSVWAKSIINDIKAKEKKELNYDLIQEDIESLLSKYEPIHAQIEELSLDDESAYKKSEISFGESSQYVYMYIKPETNYYGEGYKIVREEQVADAFLWDIYDDDDNLLYELCISAWSRHSTRSIVFHVIMGLEALTVVVLIILCSKYFLGKFMNKPKKGRVAK